MWKYYLAHALKSGAKVAGKREKKQKSLQNWWKNGNK